MSQTEKPSRQTVIGIGIGSGIGMVISHLLFDEWVGLPWSLLGVAIVTAVLYVATQKRKSD